MTFHSQNTQAMTCIVMIKTSIVKHSFAVGEGGGREGRREDRREGREETRRDRRVSN